MTTFVVFGNPRGKIRARQLPKASEDFLRDKKATDYQKPFCRYGTQVVEACIDNSTAYVDTTGEHVWVHEMTTKLHEKAQGKGVIVSRYLRYLASLPPGESC
jgi:hypothetical protein